MKRLFVLIAVCLLSVAVKAQQPLSADYDPRTELVSIVCQLAGFGEYNQCYFADYAAEVDAYFGQFKQHPAVTLMQSMRSHVSYDAPMAFALRLRFDDDSLVGDPLVAFDSNYYQRWRLDEERQMVSALNDFVRKSQFATFFHTHRPFYSMVETAMQMNLNAIDMGWFDTYFEPRADAERHVVVSTLNGPSNYGHTYATTDGKTHICIVMGCCFPDKNGNPAYQSSTLIPIIVHEFCHSYCNPLVDRFGLSECDAAKQVFAHNKKLLSSQAYPTPLIMMNETFVRASVIRYMELHFPQYAAAEPLANEEELGFWLAPTMLESLRRREMSATPLMSDYMPTMLADLKAFSLKGYMRDKKTADRMMAHVKDCKMPSKSGEGEIVIRFDKPMADHLALYSGNTGHPFPTLSDRRPYYEWSKDRKTLTLFVNLAPGDYAFSVYKGFVTTDGHPLAKVKFYSFSVTK